MVTSELWIVKAAPGSVPLPLPEPLPLPASVSSPVLPSLFWQPTNARIEASKIVEVRMDTPIYGSAGYQPLPRCLLFIEFEF
jgi:hypothetical protein